MGTLQEHLETQCTIRRIFSPILRQSTAILSDYLTNEADLENFLNDNFNNEIFEINTTAKEIIEDVQKCNKALAPVRVSTTNLFMIDWDDCERYTYFNRDYAEDFIRFSAERFLKYVAFFKLPFEEISTSMLNSQVYNSVLTKEKINDIYQNARSQVHRNRCCDLFNKVLTDYCFVNTNTSDEQLNKILKNKEYRFTDVITKLCHDDDSDEAIIKSIKQELDHILQIVCYATSIEKENALLIELFPFNEEEIEYIKNHITI